MALSCHSWDPCLCCGSSPKVPRSRFSPAPCPCTIHCNSPFPISALQSLHITLPRILIPILLHEPTGAKTLSHIQKTPLPNSQTDTIPHTVPTRALRYRSDSSTLNPLSRPSTYKVAQAHGIEATGEQHCPTASTAPDCGPLVAPDQSCTFGSSSRIPSANCPPKQGTQLPGSYFGSPPAHPHSYYLCSRCPLRPPT